MKLIPLSDYVDKISLKEDEYPQNEEIYYYSFYRKITNYNNFLKLKLKKKMFRSANKKDLFFLNKDGVEFNDYFHETIMANMKTIEALANSRIQITLTPSALQAIGIKES